MPNDQELANCEKDYRELSIAYNAACVTAERQRAEIARILEALHDARQALNLALLANDFGGDIKGRLRTAWLKIGDALTTPERSERQ